MNKVNPSEISKPIRETIRNTIDQHKYKINMVGFLCNDDPAAEKYAQYTRSGCEEVGINFELIKVPRLEIENAIIEANANDEIHGIFIYYPIFNVEQDSYLKNLVSPHKDVEGLNQYWLSKLYNNIRFDDEQRAKKAILPCTPLAIVKMINHLDIDPSEKTMTIFNRSEVVGRPLATMLANDGARVYSFDEHGALLFEREKVSEVVIDRESALAKSDLIITGVPSKKFHKIQKSEIAKNTVGINFSTIKNFEEDTLGILEKYIPRVGPLTVTMCLRNSVRLFENYSKG